MIDEQVRRGKEKFIRKVNATLIRKGMGRFDDLKENPFRYVVHTDEHGGYTESVERGNLKANVTGDSFEAMLEDMHAAHMI